MKHRSKKKKLSLKRDQRQALLKSLAQALILKEKITTTEAKAKALKPVVEKMITRAKKQDLNSIRFLRRYLSSDAIKKLQTLTRQRYSQRQGGYLRITKLPLRQHDNAKMAIISFVE